MRLEGKVCLVTGGASGMGRVAAAMFCREGAKVAVADVTAEPLEAAAAEAKAAARGGGDAFAVQCDVTREQQVKDAPASISVITREELERLPYRELTDALLEIPAPC